MARSAPWPTSRPRPALLAPASSVLAPALPVSGAGRLHGSAGSTKAPLQLRLLCAMAGDQYAWLACHYAGKAFLCLCALLVRADYGNCDATDSNGCETDLTSTVAHCGACATDCNTNVLHATGKTCAASVCDYGSCDASRCLAGCHAGAAWQPQVHSSMAVRQCGLPGVPSALLHDLMRALLPADYGNCDSNRANGCETDLRTTVAHCGACATDCNTNVQHASGKTCAASICDYGSCDAGRCQAGRHAGAALQPWVHGSMAGRQSAACLSFLVHC